MRCLQCGKDCQDDFVTCSEACNLAYRSGHAHPAGEELDAVPDGVELVTIAALCERLGIPQHKVYNDTRAGKLRRGEHFFRTTPRRTMYDPLKTANALDVATVPVPRIAPEPPADGLVGVVVEDSVPVNDGTGDHIAKVQVRGVVTPDEVGSMLQVETVRTRGLAAAKEAFRDVLLAEADHARSRGEYRLQARLLEDYVFFEEGLKMVYDGRADV